MTQPEPWQKVALGWAIAMALMSACALVALLWMGDMFIATAATVMSYVCWYQGKALVERHEGNVDQHNERR